PAVLITAATAAPTTTAIGCDCINSSGNDKSALSFRRSGADEVLARLKPKEPVLAKIVGPRRLHNIHHALPFQVGISQPFHIHVGEWLAVTIEHAAGDGSCRHELQDDVGHPLARA